MATEDKSLTMMLPPVRSDRTEIRAVRKKLKDAGLSWTILAREVVTAYLDNRLHITPPKDKSYTFITGVHDAA